MKNEKQSGYGQQGYQSVYGSAGQGTPPQPPGKNNTVLIVALVAILVATAGFGAWWILGRDNQPNATPLHQHTDHHTGNPEVRDTITRTHEENHQTHHPEIIQIFQHRTRDAQIIR